MSGLFSMSKNAISMMGVVIDMKFNARQQMFIDE